MCTSIRRKRAFCVIWSINMNVNQNQLTARPVEPTIWCRRIRVWANVQRTTLIEMVEWTMKMKRSNRQINRRPFQSEPNRKRTLATDYVKTLWSTIQLVINMLFAVHYVFATAFRCSVISILFPKQTMRICCFVHINRCAYENVFILFFCSSSFLPLLHHQKARTRHLVCLIFTLIGASSNSPSSWTFKSCSYCIWKAIVCSFHDLNCAETMGSANCVNQFIANANKSKLFKVTTSNSYFVFASDHNLSRSICCLLSPARFTRSTLLSIFHVFPYHIYIFFFIFILIVFFNICPLQWSSNVFVFINSYSFFLSFLDSGKLSSYKPSSISTDFELGVSRSTATNEPASNKVISSPNSHSEESSAAVFNMLQPADSKQTKSFSNSALASDLLF